jgi:hypothetical protein
MIAACMLSACSTWDDTRHGELGGVSHQTTALDSCRCPLGARAVLDADERLVGAEEIPLAGLGCTAWRVTAMRRSPDSEIRHLMKDPDGALCSWQEVVTANSDARARRLRETEEQALQALGENWRGDVIVWLKHEPFSETDVDASSEHRFSSDKVEAVVDRFATRFRGKNPLSTATAPAVVLRDVTREEVLALRGEPDVGRIVIEEGTPAEITELCTYCTSMDGFQFNLQSLTSATNFGAGFPAGILEQFVYDCGGLSPWCPLLNGQPVDDQRVHNWTAAAQVAPCSGLDCVSPTYHENKVASRLWGQNAPLKNGQPVSVGIGQPSFANYLTALQFFWQHGAKVINRSIFDGVAWAQCGTAPTLQHDLLQDYHAYFGVLFVQAVGNLCGSSGPLCIRLSNALTVGGKTAAMSQTQNAAFYAGRLELPNVVGNCYGVGTDCSDVFQIDKPGFSIFTPEQDGWHMCAYGNSYNAPAVTAIASMIQKAATSASSNAKWPESLRAIIMAGADYTPFQGLDTASYCSGCVGQYTYCPPVDCKYGAGALDGAGAWSVYQQGNFVYNWGNPDPGWSTVTPDFRCQQSSCYLKAALAWSNAVDCDTYACYDDGHVSHDFGLCLERRWGTCPMCWYTPVVCSDASESTAEWFHYTISNQSTYYRIRTFLVSRTVPRVTFFTLAYQAAGTSL